LQTFLFIACVCITISMGFLSDILPVVKKTIDSGYYNVRYGRQKYSLVEEIESASAEGIVPVIAEIKPSSPTEKELVKEDELEKLINDYGESDAAGISVLTEPVHFKGDITLLKHDFQKPALMKDFILSEKQVGNGDAVLLIQEFLDLAGVDANELVDIAHERDLEVVLEVNSLEAFRKAKKTEADIIGINNRDLQTLKVDLNTTASILQKETCDRIIISESGIVTRETVRKLLDAGVDGVLVGTAILKSADRKKAIDDFVNIDLE